MAKTKSARLTHTFIKSVTKEGRYGDGRGGFGLSLLGPEDPKWRVEQNLEPATPYRQNQAGIHTGD